MAIIEKSAHQLRVEELMNKIPGQTIPEKFTLPDERTRKLRVKVVLEEALELAAACGVTVSVALPNGQQLDIVHGPTGECYPLDFSVDGALDIVEYVDACADVIVTATGSLSAVGVPDETVLTIVDNNNLKKFGPGHSFNEDGKLIKPPGFTGPTAELEALLDILKGECGGN